MINIDIFRDERFATRESGANMPAALRIATATARLLAQYYEGDTTLFLRDGLGGLRAEVRKRNGNITVRKYTSPRRKI